VSSERRPPTGEPDQPRRPERTAGGGDKREQPELSGPDLARAALEAAKAKRRTPQKKQQYRRRGYSGPGPDARDPQTFGTLLAKLVADRGWQRPAAEATVFGAWERVVGVDVAAHCRPVKLTDGELTIEAESTAWATQLRMLSARILAKIAEEVRPSPVRRLRIHGPAAPSWQHGPLRVRGQGPGDTYG